MVQLDSILDIFSLVHELCFVFRSKWQHRQKRILFEKRQRLIEQHWQAAVSKATTAQIPAHVPDSALESFQDLPDLCQRQVFRFLNVSALAACQLTCRKWNTMINGSLKRLPKRELYRVKINFNDRKITMQWLTTSLPITYKYRTFDFAGVELLSKQMTHFIMEECHIIGSNMLTDLPKLRMSEQKVKTIEIRHLTVALGGHDKEALLNFIDSLENSLERLIFRSNCEFGLTLNDEFFARPWMANLKSLDLSCKCDLTVDILKRFDRKKLSNLSISENKTPFAAQSIADFISATVVGEPTVYFWVRQDVDQLREALVQQQLSVTIENNTEFWTNLVVCRNSCLLADITVCKL